MHSSQENIYTFAPRRTSASISGNRRDLLNQLLRGIEADEASANSLLQAFDLDRDIEATLDKPTFSAHQTPLGPITNTLNTKPATTLIRNAKDFKSERSASSHYENTFLATPLRVKYFSSLNPDILRQLLRTPSPHGNWEMGLGSDSASAYMRTSLPSIPSLEFSTTRSSPPQTVAPLAYPLTPPSTARIPCHETPVPVLRSPDAVNSPGFRFQAVDIDSVPDIKACLSSMTPFATTTNQNKRQKLPFSLSALPSSPVARPTHFSASQRVADEIRVGEEILDEERAFFMSQLQDPPLVEETPVHVITRPMPDTPASPSLRPYKATRNVKKLRSTGRIMQREFAELLETRARQEEEYARELAVMANRLERLALQRRQLATLMINDTKS
ncbi:hypothetical protein BDP27DRAFT_1357870 [Rhodocollybia butyracea]|uniref:Uncharacterized protein n=1 Tax=Rhodocollybia butyracea TaxID=206335 RepID=A0A9P5UEM9_9AGAR|nr:hypothetical protein BDP27DRAFT_1357870 [Rhodocollybia butyracea]